MLGWRSRAAALGLALEAHPALGVLREVRVQHLDGHLAVERGSCAR
jgi:hypothetical protein